MAFARARAARTLQSSFRRAIPRVSAPGRTQLVQRRWASEGGHGHAEPGSDLPWILAGVAVTVPSCWYLWPDSSHADHGHHGDHEEEGEHEPHEIEKEEKDEEGEAQEEEPKDEESGPTEDAKTDTKQEQQKEEKVDEEKSEEKSEQSEEKEEGGQKRTAKVFKDDESKPTKAEANSDEGAEVKKVQTDRTIRKPLPSSGQPLTKSPAETKGKDEAMGSGGSMESKQGGLSNTQARHSINIADSPDKSKKPEGVPDTAKTSGTVPVKRHD